MIALLLEDRCTDCRRCVDICPTLVFDEGPGHPVIARPAACQTCYMCEIYCPADALYVAPDQRQAETVTREAVIAGGHLGRIRHDQGWLASEAPDMLDVYWRLGPLLNEGAENAERRWAQRP